jgi:hypothetical protein
MTPMGSEPTDYVDPPPGEGMASRWEGVGSVRGPRLLANHFPLPSSASLPKTEADDGLIRAVEGGKGLSSVREGALC